MKLIASIATTFAVAAALLWTTSAHAAGDWNDAQIKWMSYNDGLAAAKKEDKPVCLIFYTEWCPHCKNYSKVFHDEKVVAESKNFVMIRLDGDKNKELSQKFAVDGAYIPRTFFLDSDGKLDDSIHAPRDKFKYFYDEANPASVLAGMEAAKAKLK